MPGVLAETENEPATWLALSTGDVAMPEELVGSVAVPPPGLNVAPAPPDPAWTVKVTFTFWTGFPLASTTSACSGPPYGEPTVAVWLPPEVGMMFAVTP